MKQTTYIMFLFLATLSMAIFIAAFFVNFDSLLIDNKNIKNAKAHMKDNKIYQFNDFLGYFNEVKEINTNYKDNNILDITFNYDNKSKKNKNELINNLSELQKEFISSPIENRVRIMKFAYKNGFNKEQSVLYAFPELKEIINQIEKEVFVEPKNSRLISEKNTANVIIEKAKKGVKMDKKALFDTLYSNFCNFLDKFSIEVKLEKIDYYNIDLEKELRGEYKTSFKSSNESRKNNIKRALESIDGVVINPNESLSFNKTTGLRTENNGYMKARIIKEGTFYEEFGGGVCQVSTTLYNAALLAGLEISEVHPHSLPVSYIEPCFDAMVNSGTSDLIIKNITSKPIIIATSNKNDICLVRIYGEKNPYKIIRKSEKVEEIPEFEKIETNDYKKYGLSEPLEVNQTKVISYGKPGYKAIGKLEYYKDDILIKTKQIREHIYKPTKEVVLVS